MNRRDFIRTTGASAAAPAFCQPSSLFALEAENAYRKSIGIQLYTLRNEIEKDPLGTIKQVAASMDYLKKL